MFRAAFSVSIEGKYSFGGVADDLEKLPVVRIMLACIACSKRLSDGSLDASSSPRSPAFREAIGNLATQVYTILLKFCPERIFLAV